MQSENITFLQALKFKNCELWNSRGNDLCLDGVNDLTVIYSRPLDQFILRIQDLRILLDKSVQVFSSIVGRHQRQAFLLASRDGFSMIKLIDYSQSSAALHNLETILEATTNFSRKWGFDPILATFTEKHESTLKESLVSALGAVSKVFGAQSDFESHPNQKFARSLDELKDLDSHATAVVDLSKSELEDLKEKLEKEESTYQSNAIWGKFLGNDTQFPVYHKKTEDVTSLDEGQKAEHAEHLKISCDLPTCKFNSSIDSQEVVGAQEQRLPYYEVQDGKELDRKGLRKASNNLQQPEKKSLLPVPEDIEDESFTTGLLTTNYKEATNLTGDKDFPISSEDAFSDLTHPMRKYSAIDRPFLQEDYMNTNETQGQGSFASQPLISAGGRTNLKSDIDEQPSPISNKEKYRSEVAKPETSEFEKATEGTQKKLDIPFGSVGQENIRRESSQGNETKKQKRAANEAVDKENMQQETTAI